MCKTMFLHFVPVDGVEYFSGIFGREGMFLCFYVSRNKPGDMALSRVFAGDDARSHVWTVWVGSDAIVPSYGPIVIVLLLGFCGGS